MFRVQPRKSRPPVWAAWALMLALVLVLAACGGGQQSDAEEEPAALGRG